MNNYGSWTFQVYSSNNFTQKVNKVLIKGNTFLDNESTMVRVHSECFTGDVIRSALCDCGDQLQKSIKLINDKGKGILIIPCGHEGRGIGLTNKIRAYKLMSESNGKIDTYEANRLLGFNDDERDYNDTLEILHQLKIKNINLLTSNPHKISALGSIVKEITPVVCEPTLYNKGYLSAKAKKHKLIDDITHSEIYPTKKVLSEMPNFPIPTCPNSELKIGIIRANWHSELLIELEQQIEENLIRYGIKKENIIKYVVPGAYEIIMGINKILRNSDINSIICLGILMKGDTAHFEYVSQGVMQGITDLQLKYNVPIINGILNCYTLEQARERCLRSSKLAAELSISLTMTCVYMASEAYMT